MRMIDIPSESRPRERLQQYGERALSTAELLAVIFQKGTRQENVLDMSNKLLATCPAPRLATLSLSELQQVSGIGPAKAMQLKAVFELAKRCYAGKAKGRPLTTPKAVFQYVVHRIPFAEREVFLVLHLNTKHKVVKEEIISLGTLNASLIHPREVFRSAVKEGSYALLIAHNHPSGDPSPSDEDILVTKKLLSAGEILGIHVLDHVIIGHGRYWSWAEDGKAG